MNMNKVLVGALTLKQRFTSFFSVIFCLISLDGWATAADRPPSPFCREAFIEHLVLEEQQPNTANPKRTDYCQIEDPNFLPKAIRNAIQKIKSLHLKVAQLFGRSPEEVFRKGIHIIIKRSDLGPLASKGGHYLVMPVFTDWPNHPTDQDHTINDGIYLHELGHYLSAGGLVSQALKDFAREPIFSETFADSLALHIAGTLVSPIPDMPACFHDIRPFPTDGTYYSEEEFFTTLAPRRKLHECCVNHASDTSLNPRFISFCQFFEKKVEESLKRAHLTEFPPMKPNPVDLRDLFIHHPEKYDSHQMGIPVNLFLLEFQKALHIPIKELYFDALMGISDENSFDRISCTIESRKEFVSYTNQKRSFTHFLSFVRARLSEENQLIFDRIMKKFGIDSLLSAMNEAQVLEEKISAWKTWTSPASTGRRQQVEAALGDCYKGSSSQLPSSPECEIICTWDKMPSH